MLIRVKAAGLATTDLLVMLGVLAPFVDHVFPLIPGFDASGVVEKVGPAVVGFAVGDEVFGYRRLAPMGRGTMAVFVALATDTAQHKPSHLKHEQVAVFPHCGLTAQAAVEAAAISDGTSVVILGATGGVGSFATQLAAQAGGHVIGVARGQNHDYARALGAAHAFDYEASDPVAEVRDHYPDGVDALIDLAGIPELAVAMAANVHSGGRVVSVIAAPDVDGLATRGVQSMLTTRLAAEHRLEDLTKRLAAGTLQFPQIQTFPFDQIDDAIALQSTRHVRGKLAVLLE